MDDVTKTLAELVSETKADHPELVKQAGRAFADYLAAALSARKKAPVRRLARWTGRLGGDTFLLGQPEKAGAEEAALFNGFTSHYLDYDDAQANVMGHMSTVIFSALLSLARPEDTVSDFINAYLAGSELEGILGEVVNPAHKRAGWHPTATLGAIGAAAAIARFRHLGVEDTAEVLSLGATQAGGLGLEAGTDTKPLHAGFAARDGVTAYVLHEKAGLTSSDVAFNNEDGWVKAMTGKTLDAGYLRKRWLSPGQIVSPGLWMKSNGYCSAGMSGAAAAVALYEAGFTMDNVKEVIFHFTPGAGYSLHYDHPQTGQEGRFSLEYIVWQIFTFGEVRDEYFELPKVPEAFAQALPKFRRVDDLPPVAKDVRETAVEAVGEDGRRQTVRIKDPPGSPGRPFTEEELFRKLAAASDDAFAAAILEETGKWPEGILAPLLQTVEAFGK